MPFSKVSIKGRTTIPKAVRQALRIRSGDDLVYVVKKDYAIIRVHPNARSLRGVLASEKGKGMSFTEIRRRAAKAVRKRAP
jgi:AbrB family looped-hinge helix DNA binding protein